MIIDKEYSDFLLKWAQHLRAGDYTMADAIIKVGEEYGEVCDEWILFRGINPRKPRQTAGGPLAGELADVIMTAMTAMVMWGFDPNDMLELQRQKTIERFPDAAL